MRRAFVVVVGVADLESVKARWKFTGILDADQVTELVRYHVRKPAVATADLEVPVGEPEIDGVLAWNGAAVTV